MKKYIMCYEEHLSPQDLKLLQDTFGDDFGSPEKWERNGCNVIETEMEFEEVVACVEKIRQDGMHNFRLLVGKLEDYKILYESEQ